MGCSLIRANGYFLDNKQPNWIYFQPFDLCLIFYVDSILESGKVSAYPVRQQLNSLSLSPSGEIGRHKGFKIPRLIGVPVQFRPRAPIS